MKLCKIRLVDGSMRVAVMHDAEVQPLDLTQINNCHSLMDILNSADPAGLARFLLKPDTRPLSLSEVTVLAPLDLQEVWAAGASAVGAVKNYEASKTLDPSWNPDHMHWVALAYDKSTYRVLQAIQISVK